MKLSENVLSGTSHSFSKLREGTAEAAPSRIIVRTASEIEFQCKLNDARPIHCRKDRCVTASNVNQTVVLLKGVKAGEAGRLRALERRVVENVEELGAELHVDLLNHLGLLDNGYIPILLKWAAEAVA